MAETRTCEQCGGAFEPRREHARFCSARCRVAWNRENASDRRAESSALDWSIIAMREATDRLRRVRAGSRPQAFAVISEAVWWVTIVDGTLMRYHPDAYDRVMAGLPPDGRQATERTFSGLRFVRNWMGYHVDHADFIAPQELGPGPETGHITEWTWKPLPEPALWSLAPRGQEWEMRRYRAYQAELAGQLIGQTFTTAATFLRLAATMAAPTASTAPTGAQGGELSRHPSPAPGGARRRAMRERGGLRNGRNNEYAHADRG
jgi:hypothetical protein